MSDGREGKDTSRIPFIKDASENLPPDVETNEVSDKTEQTITKKKHMFTRRDVLAMCGCGVAGLVVGGALASWGGYRALDCIRANRDKDNTTKDDCNRPR